ncbi:MAG TPA: FAD-dependent monooxygenase, partial [Hyphomonas sp.]|nr:FAD-dependent monooxygenase [Hyphomonas sp.]
MTILGELGLRERAETLGAPIRRLHGQAVNSGRTVLDVRYDAIRPSLRGISIQRPVLFDLVYQAAREAGANIVPSTRIIAAQAVGGYLTTGDGKTLGPF